MPTPPKPTSLKLLEGNRGKRGLKNREPDPDYLDQLEPPAWLPDDAQAVWSELAFRLRKAKLLTVIDVPALEQLCVSIAHYRRATLQIGIQNVAKRDKDKEGKSVPEHDVLNPWMIVQAMSFKQSIALMREFGMTPAARTRVLVDPQLGLFGNGDQDKAAGYFT